MKSKAASINLLITLGLLPAVVMGCSSLRKSSTPSLPGSGSSASGDYFPLSVGDSWKYKYTASDGKKYELTTRVLNEEREIGNTLYRVETVKTDDWYLKPNGSVLLLREQDLSFDLDTEFKPVKQFLKNPLANGDSWHWEGKGMLEANAEEANSVSGPETVTVPAGKFTAMKVTTNAVQAGIRETRIKWFAPSVGLVKAMTDAGDDKTSTELLEYNVKQ